jgi:hypothetical protein
MSLVALMDSSTREPANTQAGPQAHRPSSTYAATPMEQHTRVRPQARACPLPLRWSNTQFRWKKPFASLHSSRATSWCIPLESHSCRVGPPVKPLHPSIVAMGLGISSFPPVSQRSLARLPPSTYSSQGLQLHVVPGDGFLCEHPRSESL